MEVNLCNYRLTKVKILQINILIRLLTLTPSSPLSISTDLVMDLLQLPDQSIQTAQDGKQALYSPNQSKIRLMPLTRNACRLHLAVCLQSAPHMPSNLKAYSKGRKKNALMSALKCKVSLQHSRVRAAPIRKHLMSNYDQASRRCFHRQFIQLKWVTLMIASLKCTRIMCQCNTTSLQKTHLLTNHSPKRLASQIVTTNIKIRLLFMSSHNRGIEAS